MFIKAFHALRMMLLALVVQIGNLAKIGTRKGYDHNYENQRQLRHVENDLKQVLQWNSNDLSRLPLDDPSKYQLSLTGKLEPASHLPTINLSGDSSRIGSKWSNSPGYCNCA